ncbi:MAG: glutaredoxin 3 [Pseudomonadales bacterium]
MAGAEGHAPVRMYSTEFCPYCVAARRLFNHLDISFDDTDVNSAGGLRQQMMAESGGNTVPQIWVGDTHVGGCDELYQLHESGGLQALLFPAK